MANTPTVYVICDNNCKYEGLTKEQILTAITQAVNEGAIGDINTGFVTKIKTINNKYLQFFVGEQWQYDALDNEAKQNLFALITNDTTKDGILKAISDLKDGTETVGRAAYAENAKNAENANEAINDSSGRKIEDTYAEKFSGYLNFGGFTYIASGTLMVYCEPTDAATKYIGTKIASGEIGLAAVGSAQYARPYGTGDNIKVNREAVVLGLITNDSTNGKKYLIQFI